MKRIFVIAFAIFTLCNCGNTKQNVKDMPIGAWIEPVPGMETMTQGFILNEDFTAKSINMATLVYEKWSYQNGEKPSISLTGKSIGNGQTIEFTETYTIQKMDADSLILARPDGQIQSYSRQK